MEVDSDIKNKIEKLTKDEVYNTQLFEITAEKFVCKVKDAFEEKSTELVDKLETELIEAGESSKETILAMKRFKSLTFSSHASSLTKKERKQFDMSPDHVGIIDEVFDIFEMFVKIRYFAIPAHILLPEDACHGKDMPSDATLASNKKLYFAVLEEKQLAVHLKARREELDVLKAELEKMKERMKEPEKSIDDLLAGV